MRITVSGMRFSRERSSMLKRTFLRVLGEAIRDPQVVHPEADPKLRRPQVIGGRKIVKKNMEGVTAGHVSPVSLLHTVQCFFVSESTQISIPCRPLEHGFGCRAKPETLAPLIQELHRIIPVTDAACSLDFY